MPHTPPTTRRHDTTARHNTTARHDMTDHPGPGVPLDEAARHDHNCPNDAPTGDPR